MRLLAIAFWIAVALAGAASFSVLATARGEPVSAAHLVAAALCSYAIAYRFYSRFLATRVLGLDAGRPTPAVSRNDGRDFVPTNRWVVFGHHFAAIAGPGPLVGPILAAQFGYLPGAIWILLGVVLGGAVQDFVILVASMRRDGRSLARLARDALGPAGALAATLAILLIMVILMAVLGVVVVNALAQSPWGLFTVAATVPIAFLMGAIMRGGAGPRVIAATAIGLALLAAALVSGHAVSIHPVLGPLFTRGKLELAVAIIAYGFTASVLPIWLLLAPRDYLSSFVKLGTIFALAAGILAVRPPLLLPAVTTFASGGGPFFGGKVFPFCFITIACGAISGFHALVASGTTPRLLERETDARMVGYGSMLLESFVAIMALCAAAALPPGQYFAISSTKTLEWITAHGFPVSAGDMGALARRMGEATVAGRTGGAPCLAVGMAEVFRRALGGDGLAALWYHFAIMFEALFILTTLDAGTRVGRLLLEDGLGAMRVRVSGARGEAPGRERRGGMLRAIGMSALFCSAWGYFVVAGALDASGGVRALWPLFGIANQLLAVTALAIATTILVRTGRSRFAWVTLGPLLVLLAITATGALEKIFHEDPSVGFLALARALESGALAGDPGVPLGMQVFDARLDALLAALFLGLVAIVLGSAAREWWRVLSGARAIEPDDASSLPEAQPGGSFGEIGDRPPCC